MELDLHLGTSKVDITPEYPVPLTGFGSRTGTSYGVAHRLYLRIFVFEQTTDKGNRAKSLLVSADLIGWGTERMEHLRAALHEKFGIDEHSIILQGTHTHSAPQTSELLPALAAMDRLYVQELENKLLAGVEQALQNLEPVTAERGKGQCAINIHRRKLIDGEFRNAPNEEGPVDRDVNVVRFNAKKDGSEKAVIVHYTCHPTTTNGYAISSEYCGVAMEEVEKAYEDRIISGFFQGCTGDIRPALIRNGRFYSGTDQDVCERGEKLANEVIKVLKRNLKPLGQVPFRSKRKALPLQLREIPSIEELENMSQQNDINGVWSRTLLNHPDLLRQTMDFDLVLIHIADGLSFLAMNGEVVIEYGFFVKQMFDDAVLPVPYSNGLIGYIPTAKQIEEGGYEPEGSCKYFSMPAPFEPSLEKDIKEGIVKLANEISLQAKPS